MVHVEFEDIVYISIFEGLESIFWDSEQSKRNSREICERSENVY